MLQKGNQGRGHRNYLLGRHVHVINPLGRHDGKLVHVTHGDQVIDKFHVLVQGRRRLGDDMLGLVDRGQKLDLFGNLAIHNLAVGAFEEAVLVGAGVGGQRVDQADVRAFRCLDGTDPAVVSRVYVPDFEARAFTRQAARPERRNAPLVRHFRQRVVLVHELGQLAGTEELLDRRRNRLGVDQILRHQAFAFSHGQALLDGALNPYQADTELVFSHLAHRPHTAVTEVVDIVNHAATIADRDQGSQHLDDILAVEYTAAQHFLAAQATVELHPANR